MSFQAEVAQLLHLVTHSLYSNQEIFLRELISNASDACDKLRFEGLNNAALFEDAPNLEVRVTFDKAAKTLTITDNGIGMSQQEAIDHLGTIAKSGTKDFMGRLSGDQKADAQLIGQFGVGFYSRLHRGRQDHRGIAPCWPASPKRACAGRAAARATSRSKPSPRPRAAPSIILHLREDAERIPQRLEARAGHRQVLRPHQPAHPDGKGRVERRRADNPKTKTAPSPAAWSRPASGKPSTRPAPCGRAPRRTSPKSSTQEFYKTISHDHEDAADLGAQPRRRQHRVHAAAVHPRQGPVRPVEPRQERRA